mmetsp:Transcript_30349/g.42299  ORF Transcript_30349/g.42299 Transcript_30349/m.42299 type:complete len:200 (+) Transcript_30349:374-973(+)
MSLAAVVISFSIFAKLAPSLAMSFSKSLIWSARYLSLSLFVLNWSALPCLLYSSDSLCSAADTRSFRTSSSAALASNSFVMVASFASLLLISLDKDFISLLASAVDALPVSSSACASLTASSACALACIALFSSSARPFFCAVCAVISAERDLSSSSASSLFLVASAASVCSSFVFSDEFSLVFSMSSNFERASLYSLS